MSNLDLIRGRQVVAYLTNKSGGAIVAGDVVIMDGSNDESFTTTTSASSLSKIGVAQESIANNAAGRVLTAGYASLVNVSASATRAYFLFTHTVAKQATSSATYAQGAFGRVIKAGTSPSALIYDETVQSVGAVGSSFIGARVTETTAQVMTHATAAALTSNDAEIIDTNAFHDTSSNTARMTIPASPGTGKYALGAYAYFAGNITGERELYIRRNGTTTEAEQNKNAIYNAGYATHVEVSTGALAAVATDYFEAVAYQDSGGNLNCTLVAFWIQYLGT